MANLVTSEKILPLIQPVLADVNVETIKSTPKILEYRIESNNRTLDREKVETLLDKNTSWANQRTKKNIKQMLSRSEAVVSVW